MATSQNGWPASPNRREIGVAVFTVADVDFPGGVKAGDVDTVLRYVVTRFHLEVEPLKTGWCWGWAYRDVRGAGSLSNHASGTAVDVNAPAHPLGTQTFSQSQCAAIRKIVAACEGVVRWGGDYAGRKDEMHFEIVGGMAAVAALARAIRQGAGNVEEISMSAEANIVGFLWSGGPSTRTATPDPTSVHGKLNALRDAVIEIARSVDNLEGFVYRGGPSTTDGTNLGVAETSLAARVEDVETMVSEILTVVRALSGPAS